MEISSGPNSTQADIEAAKKKAALDVIPFSWKTAQVVELKPQMIMQSDFVFLNLPLKGYNKDEDIRYALSSDEFLLEIRDKSAPNRIRRVCQTLNK